MRCSHCQTEFQARTKTQRFCSAKCRRAAWSNGAGEVASLRQGKRLWSVTLHFAHQPTVNVGDFVTVVRSGRF